MCSVAPDTKAGRSQGGVEQKAEPPAAQLAEPANEGISEDDDSESLDEEDAHAQERWARVRGLTGPQESSSEDEDSSEEEDQGNALASEEEVCVWLGQEAVHDLRGAICMD